MSFNIKNKTALVTGAVSGIGLAYVRELLRHGIKNIAIVDVSLKGDGVAHELNQEFGKAKVIFIQTNVANKDELAAAFEKTFTTFNGLDIVINNAGVLRDDIYETEIAINCTAVVEGCLLANKYMGKNNGGNEGIVVNTASILGLQKLSSCPVYVATKHFVLGLTRSLGSQYYWDQTGIKFVALCPGVTDTTLVADSGNCALPGFSDLGKLLHADLHSLPVQPTSNVGEGLITLITKGENGSVWVSEGGQPIYEVEIPERTTLRKS